MTRSDTRDVPLVRAVLSDPVSRRPDHSRSPALAPCVNPQRRAVCGEQVDDIWQHPRVCGIQTRATEPTRDRRRPRAVPVVFRRLSFSILLSPDAATWTAPHTHTESHHRTPGLLLLLDACTPLRIQCFPCSTLSF